jgi:hypothetical protein
MKSYTFFFFRPGCAIPSFDIALCRDDHEARSWAPRLAEGRPQCCKVEVWDECKLVHEISWAGALAA